MSFFSSFNKGVAECVGAEIHFEQSGEMDCFLCEASIDKSRLTIGNKTKAQGALKDILPKILKKPIALTLTGKGILIKKTNKTEILSSPNLDQVFPNLKAEHFYIQNFISGESSFIALVRKETVDRLLEAFAAAGLQVLSLSLGPFCVSHILDQLNTYGNKFVFNGHSVEYTKELAWIDYVYSPGLKSEFPIKIDIEPIAEDMIIAYASAFQLLMYDNLDAIETSVDKTAFAHSEFRESLKFKSRSVAILGFFFIVLLVNIFVFNYYNEQNQGLSLTAGQSSTNMESIQQLQSGIQSQEKLIQELGWNKGISYAYLCDQIGQSTPSNVRLLELTVNPALTESNLTLGKTIVYETGKIKVSGQVTDVKTINDWMYLLKDKPWVKKINLESFFPDEQKQVQKFTLTIIY